MTNDEEFDPKELVGRTITAIRFAYQGQEEEVFMTLDDGRVVSVHASGFDQSGLLTFWVSVPVSVLGADTKENQK